MSVNMPRDVHNEIRETSHNFLCIDILDGEER